MASALGNLMANYTDSEGEEMGEGGSEGEGEGNPSLADRFVFGFLFLILLHEPLIGSYLAAFFKSD